MNKKIKSLSIWFQDRIGRFLPIIFLLGVSLIFFYPVILTKKIPLPADALVGAHTPWIEVKWDGYPAGVPIKNLEITDAVSQFYPWRVLVGKYWREGKLPLWNEYMFSGAPFLASWHSSTLYPLNALYLFLSDVNTWTVLIYLQILLAAIFTYLFINALGLSKQSAYFGAITFAFSGYMIAWLEFVTGGQAGLWLPLLLYFEFKLITESKNIYIAAIAAVFYFILSAGDFQIPFYITLTYVFFGIHLILQKIKHDEKIKVFVKFLIGLLLGFCVSSIQLFPALELFLNSIRQADPYIKEYNYGLLDWSKILNFIWPDFFGNVVTGNYWGRFGYHEYLAFTGVISIVFLTYSLLRKKTLEEKAFWILLIASLMMLFPNPLSTLPYKLGIPGIGTSSASRMIFISNFSIAILAAYGFSKWQREKNNPLLKKIIFYFLIGSAGVMIGLILNIYLFKNEPQMKEYFMFKNIKVSLKNTIPSTVVLLVAFLGVYIFDKVKIPDILKGSKITILGLAIVLLATAEMLQFSWKNTPFSPNEFLFPPTQTINFLESQEEPFRIAGPGIPLNYFMYYGIHSAEGYDSLYPLDNAQWYSLVNYGNLDHVARRYGEITSYYSPLINYANVKYLIDYKKNPQNRIIGTDGVYSPGIDSSSRYKKVNSEGRVDVFENLDVLPKIWLTKDYEIIPDKSDLIDKLINIQNQKIIYLSQPIGEVMDNAHLDYQINNYSRNSNMIKFDVDSSSDALLFLSESYSKDWKAYLDGVEYKPLKANFLFMSIFIPKGNHSVLFRYYPESFKYGLYLSIVGLVVVVAIVILGSSSKIRKFGKNK